MLLCQLLFYFIQFVARTFSVACNSDAEIFAAIQTVDTVVRTQRYLLDAGMFPILSVGRTWQEFCHDWILVGLSSGLSPWCMVICMITHI